MSLTARSLLESEGWRLSEGVRKTASVMSSVSNVFLSHSSKDGGDMLDGAIRVLRDHGGVVYADVLDPAAKDLSAAEFGSFFDTAIRDVGHLVALLTDNTADSRWVPWELGLAHGIHGLRRTAVWPVVRDPSLPPYWTTQEYLRVYPMLERVRLVGGLDVEWAVRDPADNRYWPLAAWLGL